MGAWGPGSFANGAAQDFVSALSRERNLEPVRATLAAVNDAAEVSVVAAAEGARAVVAAEIIATLHGFPPEAMPDALEQRLPQWQIFTVADDTVAGIGAVERIRDGSALRACWSQSAEGEAPWLRAIDDLLERLRFAKVATSLAHGAARPGALRAGDLLLIPVDAAGYGVGKVLRVARRHQDLLLLGLYPGRYAEDGYPAALPAQPSARFITLADPIRSGRWLRVGNQALSGEEAAPLATDEGIALGETPFQVAAGIEAALARMDSAEA